MKSFKLYIVLCLIIIFISCKNYKQDDFSVIEYSNSKIMRIHDTLIGKSYNLHEALKVRRIDEISSFLILVSEKSESNNLISLYNKSNLNHRYSFAKYGKGPGELLTPVTIDKSKNKNLFLIQDGTKQKGFIYELDSIINNGGNYIPKEESIINYPDLFCYDLFYLDDDKFLTTSFHKNKQFLIIDRMGNVIKTFGHYPDIKQKENTTKFLYGDIFQGVYDIKPDRSKMVQALLTFDEIIIYDLINDGNRVTIKTGENNPFQKEYKNTTQDFSYISTYCSDSMIYALWGGNSIRGNTPTGNFLQIFDWQGNHIKTLFLNVPLFDFCVNESEGKIYGINFELNESLTVYNYSFEFR